MSRRPDGTPATRALTAADIRFTTHTYDHVATAVNFGLEAAEKLAVDATRIFKTLLLDADGVLVVGVVPVGGRLNLKSLAAAVGARKATLADPVVAERKTGYVVGGISPIGQRTRLVTIIDESALLHDTVLVSGGRRGFDIELSPADLARVTAGTFAPVARA